MNNYELCEHCSRPKAKPTLTRFSKKLGFLNDDSANWMPFGGFGMNLNQINNQQSDATGSFGEKADQFYDAVLMGECYRVGIDPKGKDAPRTMAEAAERLFSIKDGRSKPFSVAKNRARRKNSLRRHRDEEGASYLVVDKGKARPRMHLRTRFLSLTKQNKDDIPFVQGRFNCGGTGVLPFCGDHKYQLIISRRDPSAPAGANDGTKDLWGFTLVRRQKPAAGRKSSMYVYLAPGGSILTFSRPGVNALPGSSSKNKPARHTREHSPVALHQALQLPLEERPW